MAIFFLEEQYRPAVDVSRSSIQSLPLAIHVGCAGILNKHGIEIDGLRFLSDFDLMWRYKLLHEWRAVRLSVFGDWMEKNQMNYILEQQNTLQLPLSSIEKQSSTEYTHNRRKAILYKYTMAYFQDKYYMTIDYDNDQTISFFEREKDADDHRFDLFLPILFCNAVDDNNKKYICVSDSEKRRGITADHPYIEWLVKNSNKLDIHFQRQFKQITESLCYGNSLEIISVSNNFRKQLLALQKNYGIDVQSFPEITSEDFWVILDN